MNVNLKNVNLISKHGIKSEQTELAIGSIESELARAEVMVDEVRTCRIITARTASAFVNIWCCRNVAMYFFL